MLVFPLLLISPNHGGMHRNIAETYHLILSVYTQWRRMRQYVIQGQRKCGLASSKIAGSGLMGATHHSVIGSPGSQITLKIRTVLLLYSKMKGGGMI